MDHLLCSVYYVIQFQWYFIVIHFPGGRFKQMKHIIKKVVSLLKKEMLKI